MYFYKIRMFCQKLEKYVGKFNDMNKRMYIAKKPIDRQRENFKTVKEKQERTLIA